MSLVLHGTDGVTFNDSSLQGAAASPYVLKNRIINGDMRIDQRNAGAATTPTSSAYNVDRWYIGTNVASKLTVQRNAGSVTPPAGFTNYLGITSTSAYSPSSSDVFILVQAIEGYNIADLAFGTADAKTVTLSFWVRSSLTGTFGGNIENASETQCYPFSYTISAANTWTQVSITIPGATTSTWNTDNTTGIYLCLDLGSGTGVKGTANTWQSGGKFAPTGTTNLVSTSGATIYFTGVQLEIGTSATPFERRLYGQELALCQRYFQYVPFSGTAVSTGEMGCSGMFRVEMRTAPSINSVLKNTAGYTDGTSNNLFRPGIGNAGVGAASIAAGCVNTNGFNQLYTTSGLTSTAPNNVYSGSAMMSAEL